MAMAGYTKGLHEIGDGLWAYLQPDGGWGWSNAGLVRQDEGSLLVDTLFDMRLTKEMLESMNRSVLAGSAITSVVNTHANGDHCYGNAALLGVEIVASTECAKEMAELPPSALAALMREAPALGEVGKFIMEIFAPFDFEHTELSLPTRTFEGNLELRLGEKQVHLYELGPAHTRGDLIVHLPSDGVVFTGDILFNGMHPIVWSGPVSNWLSACDRLLALDGVHTVVPGHGPLTDLQAVLDLKGYFELLIGQAKQRFEAGMSPLEASEDIDLGPYEGWSEPERLVANLNALYHELGADVPTDPITVFGYMASSSRAGI